MEEYFLVMLTVAERYVSTTLVPLADFQAIDDMRLADDLPYRLGCCYTHLAPSLARFPSYLPRLAAVHGFINPLGLHQQHRHIALPDQVFEHCRLRSTASKDVAV